MLRTILSVAILGLAGALAPAGATAERAPRPAPLVGLVFETEAGAIEVELLREAAPGAVARLLEVARGPVFDPVLFPAVADHPAGYFDGLEFELTRPRVEILLEPRRPRELFRVPTEISAAALGLDDERLADAGAAMDAIQFEILPAYRRLRSEGTVTARLAEWMATWYDGHRAEFLVGVSRREVLEALGHRFTDGLASLPVERGAVFLEPVSPTESELRLGIALAAIPVRRGKTMVVGRVVAGLEVADEISIRPLADPPAKDFRPLRPVRVERARPTAADPSDAPPKEDLR